MLPFTPEVLLAAYRSGIFPMGDDRTGAIHWYAPDPRGILPLEDFHASRTLRRTVRQAPFDVWSDRAFEAVMRACADRERTWITEEIVEAYCALHRRGYAHSVECWQEGRLVGGLYGVSIGGAFFGESMFHRVTDASKVALVHLVRWMRAGGFALLDTQFTTPHLERFGAAEVTRAEYERRLARALELDVTWPAEASQAAPEA